MLQSAVGLAVIISTQLVTSHCTRNEPIRGLGQNQVTNEATSGCHLWSWLITLRKLIISKVKFLSPPLLVLGAMNTNFINLLNITNFTSHHPPPISASEKSWEKAAFKITTCSVCFLFKLILLIFKDIQDIQNPKSDGITMPEISHDCNSIICKFGKDWSGYQGQYHIMALHTIEFAIFEFYPRIKSIFVTE